MTTTFEDVDRFDSAFLSSSFCIAYPLSVQQQFSFKGVEMLKNEAFCNDRFGGCPCSTGSRIEP